MLEHEILRQQGPGLPRVVRREELQPLLRSGDRRIRSIERLDSAEQRGSRVLVAAKGRARALQCCSVACAHSDDVTIERHRVLENWKGRRRRRANWWAQERENKKKKKKKKSGQGSGVVSLKRGKIEHQTSTRPLTV